MPSSINSLVSYDNHVFPAPPAAKLGMYVCMALVVTSAGPGAGCTCWWLVLVRCFVVCRRLFFYTQVLKVNPRVRVYNGYQAWCVAPTKISETEQTSIKRMTHIYIYMGYG